MVGVHMASRPAQPARIDAASWARAGPLGVAAVGFGLDERGDLDAVHADAVDVGVDLGPGEIGAAKIRTPRRLLSRNQESCRSAPTNSAPRSGSLEV